jgi:hypothetical protein
MFTVFSNSKRWEKYIYILLHVGIRKRRFYGNATIDRCIGSNNKRYCNPKNSRCIENAKSPWRRVSMVIARVHCIAVTEVIKRIEGIRKSVLIWPWSREEVLAWQPLKIVEIQLVSDDCKVWLYKRRTINSRYIPDIANLLVTWYTHTRYNIIPEFAFNLYGLFIRNCKENYASYKG